MFQIGDKVIVKDNYYKKQLRGLVATIISYYETDDMWLLEFDLEWHMLHNGDGIGREHHCWWIADEFLQPVYDRRTELKKLYIHKKENKEMNLLEIYFENKQIEIDTECEKACEKARKKDLRYKEIIEIQEKYKEVRGVIISVHANNYEFNETIVKEILKAINKRDNRDKELHNLKDEIRAQLEICETYEQKQHILKTYGIVDEQGKLNK